MADYIIMADKEIQEKDFMARKYDEPMEYPSGFDCSFTMKANEFASNCKGCKYSRIGFDVVSVGSDRFVSDGYKTCEHPKNDNEFRIPFLYNCPWKVVTSHA